jgi:hypothetical protein
VGLYDGFIDSEVGHLLVELRTGRFPGETFAIVTVAESLDPITTAGFSGRPGCADRGP